MTDQELRDELMTLLLAGHETTATSLAWALERAACATPRCWPASRTRREPSDDAYVDAVVKETLRLRPVLPIVVRKLTEPLELGGYELPGGHDRRALHLPGAPARRRLSRPARVPARALPGAARRAPTRGSRSAAACAAASARASRCSRCGRCSRRSSRGSTSRRRSPRRADLASRDHAVAVAGRAAGRASACGRRLTRCAARGRRGRRMTRRLTRKEQQADTRGRLLRSAAKVFGRRGFQAASLDEVAADAGFTKGAVYANFESKEDLFLAMLDERFAERRAAMQRTAATRRGARGPGPGGRRRLRRVPDRRPRVAAAVLRDGRPRGTRRTVPQGPGRPVPRRCAR